MSWQICQTWQTWEPNFLVDTKHMYKLYMEARALEAYSIRFWNPRLNRDFPMHEGWVVAPEQPVHKNQTNGKQRMDTFVEWFDDNQDIHIGLLLHEAKREGQPIKALEEQAISYAIPVILERSLQGLYILTTLGTKFRLWYLAAGQTVPQPLFHTDAGLGCKEAYIDAGTHEAAEAYVHFLTQMKGSPKLLRAPTLPSQAHLLPIFESSESFSGGSSSNTAMGPSNP
ncbi:hypothetical protein MY10362_008090 [Beauveria mimosiformis]